jgi:excisionase family DNA binding protein
MNTLDLDEYLTPESFCAAMGISRPTLQRRIAEGSLPVIRIGTAVLIAKSTVVGRRKAGRKPSASGGSNRHSQ